MQDIRELADEIRSQLCEVPATNPDYCIGRVRRVQREAHRVAYVPMTISIGPLHHNRRDLSTMQKYKKQYTKSFLQQSPHLTLEDYLTALQGLEEKARKCYGEVIDLSSREFKKMMLYDGCFIIELFLRSMEEAPISVDDPIFKSIGLLKRVQRDMIMFENQLPYFVLQCLFNISSVFNGGPSLIDLALHFFSDIVPGHKTLPQEQSPEIKHLLDLLRQSYAPSWIDQHNFNNNHEVLVHSATDLKTKAKIRFKKATNAKSLLDIKFHSNGRMEIPRLKIQAETETLFRNFMELEQCCERSNAYIADYVSFMGSLIKAWDDADLLCELGIIECPMAYDTFAITGFFRKLSKDLVVYNCYYSRVCRRVNSRYGRIRQAFTSADVSMNNCCSMFNILGFVLICLWLGWVQFVLKTT